jgi:hypothetical protein
MFSRTLILEYVEDGCLDWIELYLPVDKKFKVSTKRCVDKRHARILMESLRKEGWETNQKFDSSGEVFVAPLLRGHAPKIYFLLTIQPSLTAKDIAGTLGVSQGSVYSCMYRHPEVFLKTPVPDRRGDLWSLRRDSL